MTPTPTQTYQLAAQLGYTIRNDWLPPEGWTAEVSDPALAKFGTVVNAGRGDISETTWNDVIMDDLNKLCASLGYTDIELKNTKNDKYLEVCASRFCCCVADCLVDLLIVCFIETIP